MTRIAKVPLLTKFGGMLKNVDGNVNIDISNKTITMPDESVINIERMQPPFFRMKDKAFYKKLGAMFFIPIFMSSVLILLSIKMILFSGLSYFLIPLYLIPAGVIGWYTWASVKSFNRRGSVRKEIKYLLLVPFAFLAISVLTLREGFVLTALFLDALAMFLLEEYAIKDIRWMIDLKSVSYWKMTPPDENKSLAKVKDMFLAINEIPIDVVSGQAETASRG
jgi:hypothetical protein